jgi:hypothetical protein
MRRITWVLVAVAALLTVVGCGKQPSGVYDTRYGSGMHGAYSANAVAVTVNLQRKGGSVTGTWEGTHKGSIDGKLSGHALRGTWSDGEGDSANGSFIWNFTQDWSTFSGTFKSNDGTLAGSWNGQKKP